MNAADRVELLAPAGSMEALHAAVAAGADAVYMGASSFGARADVGFSLEKTREAIDYAHLYGRKVHITVNTLCKQHELSEVRQLLSSLQELGADAVLIQDAGILRIALREFPGLCVHASTQMTIHQPSGVRWLRDIGVRRAVLARECSLETIRACSGLGIETEVFVHGALCVSVSGQCSLSSWIGPRSGNRGRCAQPCRLSYTYRDKTGCWLSPADLCGRESLPSLLEAGVSSLKIEGRLKRPEYVYIVTNLYRRALDQIRDGTFRPDDPEAMEELTQIFSRGQFTKGYAAAQEDRGIIYPDYAAARGILIGTVSGTCTKVRDANLTDIRLKKPLANGDGLRVGEQTVIYSGPDVPSGTATLRLRSRVPEGTSVWRTESEVQLERAREAFENRRFTADHPLLVEAELTAFPGRETTLCLSHSGVRVQVSAEPAQQAENAPLSQESAFRALSKLGGTPFALDRLTLHSADAYLSSSSLNALRREGIERLTEAVIASRRPKPSSASAFSFESLPEQSRPEQLLTVLTSELSEIPVLYEAGADRVIFEPLDWTEKSLNGYFSDASAPMILQLPVVCPENVLEKVSRLNQERMLPLSLGSIGQLGAKLPGAVMCGPGVPVMNGEAELFLAAQGIRTVTLSRELSLKDLQELPEERCHRLLPVFGRPRLMLLTHCPERTWRGLYSDKKNCSLCARGEGTLGRSLVDQKQCAYPLIPYRFEEGCRVSLHAAAPTSLASRWSRLKKLSVSPLLSFTIESPEERLRIVRAWRDLMDGRAPSDPLSGTLDRLETGVQ